MAQGTEKNLYIAVGVLAVLGGALFFQMQGKKKDAEAHSLEGATANLPKLEVSEEATKKLTKIAIDKPSKEGEGAAVPERHVLVKEGDKWMLDEPVKALANQSNVESLLKNLPKLAVKEKISGAADTYERYEVDDKAALHFVAYEGETPKLELWLGKSGGRGQMVRLKDQTGVFILDGYSSFLYGRDTKGWRDLAIFTLEPEKATKVEIEGESGSFSFKKDGTAWKGEFKKSKGALAPIKDFDGAKVDDLLRAYKSLNASDFGDGKSLADAGLETPKAKLVVSLEGGEKREVHFGANAEGSSRWAVIPGNPQIYSISSWASDWAFAEESKFQKKKDEKPKAEED